jgi:hypothetical protein
MTESEKVSLTISITRACRDQVTSASAIAREIIYEHLNAAEAAVKKHQQKEDQMNE